MGLSTCLVDPRLKLAKVLCKSWDALDTQVSLGNSASDVRVLSSHTCAFQTNGPSNHVGRHVGLLEHQVPVLVPRPPTRRLATGVTAKHGTLRGQKGRTKHEVLGMRNKDLGVGDMEMKGLI